MEDVDYESLGTNSLPISLAAGALAGIAEHTAMYPIDSVKTRLQVLAPSPQAVYTGVLNALHTITTAEGARTLWRGVTSVILGAGPAHAVYFATYEQSKHLLVGLGDRYGLTGSVRRQQLEARKLAAAGVATAAPGSKDSVATSAVAAVRFDNTYTHIAHATAGALATVANDGLMTPFDVVKQRMQVHGTTHSSVLECARSVYRAEGLRGFYVSYPTTLMMSVPFQAIHFAMYEYFQDILNPRNAYDPLSHVISGGAAGAVAAFVTTPLDVAKTLLQTRTVSLDSQIQKAGGLADAFRLIYRRDGLGGFMRGANARVLANMPSTAVCWTTYEFIKMLLHRHTSS